jgi:protein-L-isoaspartate O-methyltransferase
MVDQAQVVPGQRVLEPSAGTGNLVSAIIARGFLGLDCGGQVVAVELNTGLAELLRQQRDKTLYANDNNFTVHCTDFLQCNGDLGLFDRIVMNPPFANGQDVEHVTHALHMLKPRGRLVAVMSNGVTFRQDRKTTAFRELLEARGATIEELPEDTFKESGTSVRTVLVTI